MKISENNRPNSLRHGHYHITICMYREKETQGKRRHVGEVV